MRDDTTRLTAERRVRLGTLTRAALVGALAALTATPALAQAQDDGLPRRGPGVRARGGQPTPPPRDPEQQAADRAATGQNGLAGNGLENGAADRIPPQDGDMISFSPFAEPMELSALIDFVAQTLGINVKIQGDPQGAVAFNAPVEVPREKLLDLLDSTLESYGFTITYDPLSNFYTVQETSAIRPMANGALGTTRIIETPNVKPSALQAAIGAIMGWGTTPPPTVAYVDELGVIVVTLPAREIARVESAVETILASRATITYHRIELNHVAAPAAKERAVALAGGQQSSANNPFGANNRGVPTPNNTNNAALLGGLAGGTLTNLGERLAVDAQGNALLFRGTEGELAEVQQIIAAIDVPTTLAPKRYFAGSSAPTLADIASQRGLGEVITIEPQSDTNVFATFNGNANNGFNNSTRQLGVGGPAMVVDVERGTIVYYGTESQQEQLAALLKEIGAEDERIVVRSYRLHHALAETVAELLNNVITGESAASDSPLLPGSSGVRSEIARDLTPVVNSDGELTLIGPGGDEVGGAFDPNLVIVVPDEANNQIVVRAPIGQQEQLERLISRLDLRRPQVYIEALIVSVSNTDNFRLAIETQILNGQWGLQSSFGLSTPDTGFQDQRSVAPGLLGGTFALIQSQSIPVIINALKTDTDARIVSRPSLLVNNNEEAILASVDEQPTTETNIGDTATTTSFSGFEQAGTSLTVTPTISEGGYLRLTYEVELSSFTGTATSDGIPSPRQTNNVQSSVTVPSDATIVVGGIAVTNARETIRRIPLLGHIPGIGHLFRDTNVVETESVLYIFITPRIMSDPNFYDLKLFTQGPQAEVELEDGVPVLAPVTMRMTRALPPAPAPAGDAARTGAFIREPDATLTNDTAGNAATGADTPDPAPARTDELRLEIVPIESGDG
ncbi:MAG: hypothetical protein DHS20C14_20570 [Phycisphaeraceae bacterium]|nr:MAG: hypothetical protein DHS20C14_20570 [Phycisphaeraceae bacterium]